MDILFDKINILLIITACLNLFLGVVIFLNGRNKKINIVYSLNIVAIISWVVAMILYRSAPPEMNLFWCAILYITPTFIASSFLYFTYIFPSQKDKNVPLKSLLIFAINGLIVAMVAIPGLIIKEVNVRPGIEKEIIFTKLYWLYFLYTAEFFSYGFIRLFKKYLKGVGIERLQILYLLLGYALAANFAFVTNLIMPWIGFFFLNWLGQAFTIIMVAFTSYAILKYRFMDIRIVARKTFIYFGIAAFAYGIFYLITWIYDIAFGSVWSPSAYLAGIIVAPLFILMFYVIDRRLKTFANRHFFVSLYNYQETINKLIDELNHYIDLDKIIGLIVDTIIKTMQLDRAGVLIADLKTSPVQYRIAKVIGFNEQNGISLVQDSFLTKHLQKIQKPLVRDEFLLLSRDSQEAKERESFAKLFEHMEYIEASICLPLMSSDKLIGIIVLGAKISGDAYTKEDLDLLNTLSKQAGIAIDNALLYQETKNFNTALKSEVQKATAEIQAGKAKVESALVVEKQAREELQHLNQAKTEFLNLASHQLRTPTSVIKGVASMMKGGSFNGFPEDKKKTFIEGLYEKSLKLEDIINDILNASEMTSTKFKLTLERAGSVDPETLIGEIVKGFEPKLIERQIELNIEVKDKPLPKIFCQQEFLKEALSNLIENAIKYTPSEKSDRYSRDIRQGKAQINVSVYKKDEDVIFEVKDNGIGIPKEEISGLFKKFQRGSNARNMYTDGSGLGLYIVKEIIEGHGGKVWVESELNKGSVFFVSLPITPAKEINIKQSIVEEAAKEAAKANA